MRRGAGRGVRPVKDGGVGRFGRVLCTMRDGKQTSDRTSYFQKRKSSLQGKGRRRGPVRGLLSAEEPKSPE